MRLLALYTSTYVGTDRTAGGRRRKERSLATSVIHFYHTKESESPIELFKQAGQAGILQKARCQNIYSKEAYVRVDGDARRVLVGKRYLTSLSIPSSSWVAVEQLGSGILHHMFSLPISTQVRPIFRHSDYVLVRETVVVATIEGDD